MATNIKCPPRKLTQDLALWNYFGGRASAGPDTLPVNSRSKANVHYKLHCLCKQFGPYKNNSYSSFKPPEVHIPGVAMDSSSSAQEVATPSPNLLHTQDLRFPVPLVRVFACSSI